MNGTLDKIVTKEKITQNPPKMITKMIINRYFLFNTEEANQTFASRLKPLVDIQITFAPRKY